MNAIVLGDGGFGRAIAAALADRGGPAPRVLGRPAGGRHDPGALGTAVTGEAVVFDASRGAAVRDNVAAALAAGHRRFVIGTTAWDDARPAVERALREHGAVAVAASNLSLGVALFGRLVDRAVELFGPVEAFDPYIVEWHRRTKADRPSGTAKELSRRILAAHPRKSRLADPRRDGPPEPDELDVAVVRAGGNPGSHLVGFDAAGESVELRIVARDRSAYALGALAAADWLTAAPRTPGLHGFDEVVDDVLDRARPITRRPVLVALPG
ncbi:MAG TPA: dihydrodipicolinate reductase C-terminal domain-containing protein [Candidatus Limnocylindrales bacterium]